MKSTEESSELSIFGVMFKLVVIVLVLVVLFELVEELETGSLRGI